MAASLAELTFLQTMKKAHVELFRMRMAVEQSNNKKKNERHDSRDELCKAISCIFRAMKMVESLVESRGQPDLADVDMLELELPNCIGFWRTFEIISEEDEQMFRGMANEIVTRYRRAT